MVMVVDTIRVLLGDTILVRVDTAAMVVDTIQVLLVATMVMVVDTIRVLLVDTILVLVDTALVDTILVLVDIVRVDMVAVGTILAPAMVATEALPFPANTVHQLRLV